MSNKKTESLARVVEAAIQAFSRFHYDEVLIGDIAAKARCSTATVYDAFGTKQQLYEHVRERLFDDRPRQAPLEPPTEQPTLTYLINYLVEVFQALTDPAITLLTTPASGARSSGYKPWEHTGLDFDTIVTEVSRCMDAGLLRPGDPHASAFLMYAGVSYEPMLYNLMCKEPAQLDPVAILQSIFAPLTTARGDRALRACLAKLERPPVDDGAPANLHQFMHHGSQTDRRKAFLTESMEAMRSAATKYWERRARRES